MSNITLLAISMEDTGSFLCVNVIGWWRRNVDASIRSMSNRASSTLTHQEAREYTVESDQTLILKELAIMNNRSCHK